MRKGLEHLILALDVERPDEGKELLSSLRGGLKYVKIGYQLYARGGAPFLREAREMGLSIFLDLKLHDIPNTVSQAVEALAEHGLWALTLHCAGGRRMLEEARRARDKCGSDMSLLGVTVLTSFDEASWEEVAPGCPLPEALGRRATLCKETGMDGLVCSPLDLAAVRSSAPGLFTVVPGVRPRSADDDQARVATPREAIASGADYIVVGRPILGALDRGEAVERMALEIEEGLECRKI